MVIRMLGAALTLLSGALFAANITKEHRKKEAYLEDLLVILEHFVWELQTNLTPLSVCCLAAGRCASGEMGRLFENLSVHLEQCHDATAADCMHRVMSQWDMPAPVRQRLWQLADTMGRYDLSGQIGGVKAMMELCRRDLQMMERERTGSVKSCRVLGLCTGAAVAILLL